MNVKDKLNKIEKEIASIKEQLNNQNDCISIPENIKLDIDKDIIFNNGKQLFWIDERFPAINNRKSWKDCSDRFELKPIIKEEINVGDTIVAVDDKEEINKLKHWCKVDEDKNLLYVSEEKPLNISHNDLSWKFYYKVVDKKI